MSTKRKQTDQYFLNREIAFDKLGTKMVKAAEKSPKLNPSGKAKFDYYQDPLLGKPLGVVAQQDPAASSRGANVRANKERGTQSSTQRKVIK
jgi:hypothetical protein